MIILHVDVNSAFLSWTAVRMLNDGYPEDIRNIPSAIAAGDDKSRRGIILAKSTPAKKYNIITGEPVFQALKKCPSLKLFPNEFSTYGKYSDAMYNMLLEYSPVIERYSIDECFIDYTESQKLFGDPVKFAYMLSNRIKDELGFTVNIGVSDCKVLAKMASDFEKPNKGHTLWKHEIEKKMWPLPVDELFMVAHSTAKKLKDININTIGELAQSDPSYIKTILKSQGQMVWEYANGIDNSKVNINDDIKEKSIGHSITTTSDVVNQAEAYRVLLWLSEKVVMRLRENGYIATNITVQFKTSDFVSYSHQMQVPSGINTFDDTYAYAKRLFNEGWKKEPLRLLGVSLGGLNTQLDEQLSFIKQDENGALSVSESLEEDLEQKEKSEALETVLAQIRNKFGVSSIGRASNDSKVNQKVRDYHNPM